MGMLEAHDVSIRYMIGDFKEIGLKEYVMRKLTGHYEVREFWADRNVSFVLEKGDMLGIIGSNGAGKSTLLKTISGIMEPTVGSIHREGSIAALLELGSGFDGDLTVRENTYLRGAMMGYTRKFMDDTYEQIIEFAELKDFQDRPFKQLSTGMKSRLAFSIASLVQPDILILDEVLSVGDGAFRKKSEAKMREIIQGGATTILVSHSLGQVREMCNKVLWLHRGEQIIFGDDVQGICDQYQAFLDGGQIAMESRQVKSNTEQESAKHSTEESLTFDKTTKESEISLNCQQHRSVKEDVIGIASLCVLLVVAIYFLVGFHTHGLDTPYSYNGGDGFTEYMSRKTVFDNGWIWFNRFIGAPYGSPIVDRSSWNLMSFELLVAKIIGLFVDKNPFITVNIQYLLIFPMCSISAFVVLRNLRIKRNIALLGATLFACSPYIFARGIGHFVLSTCYFVPLSILLCVWAFRDYDSQYLMIRKGFFKNTKNLLAILCAFLIANNGCGYYQFFTCFLLCATALCCLELQGKARAIKKCMITVVLIVFFFGVALTPYFIYQQLNGPSTSTVRSLGGVETYGLKIVQMFVPVDCHGIDWLDSFAQKYNSSMPLVNENRTAYLGIGGVIGFLLSLFTLFRSTKRAESENQKMLRFFSKLNICAILYATIGGFSSLFAAVTGFTLIRSVNRMSIFIMFISICVLCIYLQELREWINTHLGNCLGQIAWTIGVICLVSICLYDSLPTYGDNDAVLTANKAAYLSDKNFIEGIEAQLEDSDMVYQLPYHTYMEAGPVNKMADYHLFAGYLHSKNLMWSYGGMRGREADQWNAYVNTLPIATRLKVIISAGFKGVYIDTRAYTEERLGLLQSSIESVINEKPSVSENGLLWFYNLYPYIAKHPELLSYNPSSYELGNTVYFAESEQDAHLYFVNGISGTETDFAWTDGTEGTLRLLLTEEVSDNLVLQINLKRIYNAPQRMVITSGETALFDEVLESTSEPITVSIPADCVRERLLEINFRFPGAVSPKSLGVGTDIRRLAFGISSFTLESAKDYAARMRYKLGHTVSFDGTERDAHLYFVQGMSKTETDFAWTDGTKGVLRLLLDEEINHDLILQLNLKRIYNAPQRIMITCGDTLLFDEIIETAQTVRVPVPAECVQEHILELSLQFPGAVSPKSIGAGEDTRSLAFGIYSFSVDLQKEVQ